MRKAGNSSYTVTQAQMSQIVALCIFGIFFVFVTGYYLGKKKYSDRVIEHLEQEALTDQVYSSAINRYTSTKGVPRRDSPSRDVPLKNSVKEKILKTIEKKK